MCKFVKRSCGHFALFLALLTLAAFLALGIVPLVIARNYKYEVDRTSVTSNDAIETFSRYNGLLLTCLIAADDKDTVTERKDDFLSAYPNCMLLKTFSNLRNPSGNNLLLSSLRLAYLVFYVAGLFCGVLALVIFLLGYCGLYCASLRHSIHRSFARWCLSLGFFMFFAAIFFITGVAIYSQEYNLEWDKPADALPSVYANFPDDLKGATTRTTDIGIIIMWVAVFSVITSCAMFFLAAFKFKPSYDSDSSESTLSDIYEANIRSKEFRYQASNGRVDTFDHNH